MLTRLLLLAALALPAVVLGEEAPNFTLEDLDGKMVSLHIDHGKASLVTFWSTTCSGCRNLARQLQEIGESENLREHILLLSAEDKAALRKFRETANLGLHVLLDSGGGVAGQYGVSAPPVVVVVGKNRQIIGRLAGPQITPDRIRALIKKAG